MAVLFMRDMPSKMVGVESAALSASRIVICIVNVTSTRQ
jgi:hypothetical protein